MKFPKNQIEEFVQLFDTFSQPGDLEDKWKLGVCHMMLGNYIEARNLLAESCNAMFHPPKIWKITGHVDRLVEICIMSARTDLYPDVLGELKSYKETEPIAQGNSPTANFSYAIMELVYPNGSEDISHCIQKIIQKPKRKDLVASGKAIHAIVNKDQDSLNKSLVELLDIHGRQVAHGGLRYTSLSFQIICLHAMSVAFAARKHGLQIKAESDYFSPQYLDFIFSVTE